MGRSKSKNRNMKKNDSWQSTRTRAQKGQKHPPESAGEITWNAPTYTHALILSSISPILYIVVWPFRGFVSIVYPIYKLLASIVTWIYKRLPSIVLWISERLATFAAWLYKLPASLKAWLFSCGKNGDNGQIKFTERVGGTSPLTSQHKMQQVSIPPQVSKDTTNALRGAIEQLQEVARLKEELQQSKSENTTLKKDRKTSRGQTDTLRQQLQQSQGQTDTLRQQLQQSQIQIRNLQEDKARFQGQNDTLKRQLQWPQNQSRNLQEENARFQDENDALRRALEQSQAEVKNLQSKNEEQKTRLSKMASERMRENNITVEDLNDPHRPTALVAKWTSLFRCGEYWIAHEEIMSTKGESEAASTLYQICQVVYDSVKMYVDDLMGALQTVVTAATPPAENKQEIEGFFPQEEKRKDFLDSLRTLHSRLTEDDASGNHKTRKLIMDLLKSKRPPDSMTERVMQAIHNRVTRIGDVALVGNFVTELTPLCFAMRLQDIPVAVSFDFDAGSSVNTSLFEVEGSQGPGLEPRVVRPPLLREMGGAVLLKGELQFMKSAVPQPEEDLAGSNPACQNRGQRKQRANLESSGTS